MAHELRDPCSVLPHAAPRMPSQARRRKFASLLGVLLPSQSADRRFDSGRRLHSPSPREAIGRTYTAHRRWRRRIESRGVRRALLPLTKGVRPACRDSYRAASTERTTRRPVATICQFARHRAARWPFLLPTRRHCVCVGMRCRAAFDDLADEVHERVPLVQRAERGVGGHQVVDDDRGGAADAVAAGGPRERTRRVAQRFAVFRRRLFAQLLVGPLDLQRLSVCELLQLLAQVGHLVRVVLMHARAVGRLDRLPGR